MSKHTLGRPLAKVHLRSIQLKTLNRIIESLGDRVKVVKKTVWQLEPSTCGIWATLSVEYTTVALGNYAYDVRKAFHEAFRKVPACPEFWIDETVREVWEEE